MANPRCVPALLCPANRTKGASPPLRYVFYSFSPRLLSNRIPRARAVKSICHRGVEHNTRKQCQRIYRRRPRYRCTRRIRIILDTLMLRAHYLSYFSQSICFARQQVTALSLGQWFAVRHDFLFGRDFVPYTQPTNRRSLTPPPSVTSPPSPEKETARRLVSRAPWGFLPGQFSPNERDRG